MVLVLEALDTEPLLRKLTQERRGRRDHYPVQAMWKTIIAGIVYKKATVTGLIEELEINPGLRLLCGISSVAGMPSASAYSRFLGKLVRHEDELMAIFHRLVEALRSKLSGLGESLAIDSTDIHSWSSGRGEPPSDPDARWSGKTKGKKDGDGRPNMYWWFGYKLHLAVCGEYEIPVAFTVTPATGDDGHQVKPLLEQLEANHPELLAGTEYVIADKGYDSSDVCELLAKA